MSEGLLSLRDWWLKIHRWIGITIAVFFAIAAFTGSLLVFQDELDGLINAGRFPVSPGDVGLEQVVAETKAAYPDATFRRIQWPTPLQPVYQLVIRVGESGRTVWVDPGTGREIQPTRPNIPIMQGIRRLHTSLLAGPPIGSRLVVYTSALALISFLTGLILWWPGVKRFLRGFSVRTKRGFYAFNFDLHQTMGATVLPILALITLTGVLAWYEPIVTRVLGVFVRDEAGTVHEWPAVRVEDRTGAAMLPIVTLVDRAMAADPEGQPINVVLPASRTQPILLNLAHARLNTAGSYTTVLLDPWSGEVLQVQDPGRLAPAVRLARTVNLNVHFGAYGGVPVRILYVIVCMVGGLLAVSGVLIWWLKRRKVAEVEARRASVV